MATTIISSIRVKPFCRERFMGKLLGDRGLGYGRFPISRRRANLKWRFFRGQFHALPHPSDIW
jgi:hypothetical protein